MNSSYIISFYETICYVFAVNKFRYNLIYLTQGGLVY